MSNSCNLKIIVPSVKVFEGLTVDTIIYILTKGGKPCNTFTIAHLSKSEETILSDLNFRDYVDGEKPISTSLNAGLNPIIEKIRNNSQPLGDLADITRGVHPYRLGGYGTSAFTQGCQIQKDLVDRPYHSPIKMDGYRPFIYGKDLRSFTQVASKEYIKYGPWLAEPRDKRFFEGERIYSRKILGKTLIVTVEKGNSVTDQQVYITKPKSPFVSVNYLAALLGSRLISFYIRNYYNEVNDAFPQIKVSQLRDLPVKIADSSIQQSISKLLDQLFLLNSEKSLVKLPSKTIQINNKINYCESKINTLIYSLYGLTDDDIKILEG